METNVRDYSPMISVFDDPTDPTDPTNEGIKWIAVIFHLVIWPEVRRDLIMKMWTNFLQIRRQCDCERDRDNKSRCEVIMRGINFGTKSRQEL